ncbi:MAG: sulfur carrier protein ThiS [Planctomycetes bacterium]|nr:sulfur carrier protein ThiS [Planctomycetota bacterium]
MELIVNGHPTEAPERITVAQLLEQLRLPAVRVAVELNRAILPRKAFGQTTLAAGDRVEIVTLVGGGCG